MNRHGPCGPQDFKSCASTNFATPALFSGALESFSGRFPAGLLWSSKPRCSVTQHRRDMVRIRGKRCKGNSGVGFEATTGFEPVHKGFADLSLTTWVRRRKRRQFRGHPPVQKKPRHLVGLGAAGPLLKRSVFTGTSGAITDHPLPRRAERETGFEPATSTLARLRSTN